MRPMGLRDSSASIFDPTEIYDLLSEKSRVRAAFGELRAVYVSYQSSISP